MNRTDSNQMARVPSDTTDRTAEEQEKDIEKAAVRTDTNTSSNARKRGMKETMRPPNPDPVGFWHHSLYHVRNHVIRLWIKTVLLLCFFVLSILSIYWGSLFKVLDNLKSLTIVVVDFDAQVAPYNTTSATPLIGPMITQVTEKIAQSHGPHLGFITKNASEFNYDPIAVRQYIYDFHAWAAILINANATTLLEQAVQNGNTSYDPMGAAQLIYVEARDSTTYATDIIPQLSQLQTTIVSLFGSQWSQRVLSNTSIPRTNLARVPQALSPAIGFTPINLRPFGPPVVTPAVSIGLIYLIIISFFSFSFFLPIHLKYLIPKGHPPLHFPQLIVWRYIATVAAYFFMSLAYSFISLAFQVPFHNPPASPTEVAFNPSAYGHVTFFVYWMLNFVGMCALGLACENVAMVVGAPWTAMWLIFWVITNVSTGLYPIPTAPNFYSWGYAWPLHQIVEASRQLLFDLHSRIGLNFGVLFAWCAINTTLFPVCCHIMRWKSLKEQQKQEHHHKGR
jgi:hypothetical protein